MALPIPTDTKPMLAKLARRMPDGDGMLFEPKWDGFRCLAHRDGDHLELMSRNQRPFNRYFPELIAPLLAALPERCVIDGEIVLPDADGAGLDFDALQQRIHPAASRVAMLAEATPTRFVAFDVLAIGDRSLLDTPFAERRTALTAMLTPNGSVHLTPATTNPELAHEWFTRFEGAGLDGVIGKPLDGRYQPGKRSLVKVKHQRTAECAVAGYRIHKDGAGVGSLLLGLYRADGELSPVGVCAAFSRDRRAELLVEMQPYTEGALDDHPWADWAAHEGPGAGSRWNAGKDLSFVPVRVERVVEVTFGQLEAGRFRHGVQFVRWRPDRDPLSCRYDQLDVADPVPFDELVTQRG